MKSTKLILASVLTLALLVPMVNAAPLWSDDWFIEHAEEYVNTEYTDNGELDYEGDVVSEWEVTFRPYVPFHKMVELNAEYEDNNYYDKGTVSWYGRVYWNGEGYTNEYTDIKPTQHKVFKQSTVYLEMNSPYFYDGSGWKTYEPICYRNYGELPIEIPFTMFGYDYTFTVKPGYCLAIYTPYNNFF